ncbi:hypothetical protein JOY44_15320 [Phormidium sp. CLA17]|uniref:hypothetical protein n=1 Tax=Leptolyngbya sp. Cla-17 TaxID=2803751 RepID=UPI0018D84B23|nr:hypothetical protein [Leptolyngbya sp. Cla-17]MBM0742959.1 hypothetical protein [Leptolyngbya sp. Cla-17]
MVGRRAMREIIRDIKVGRVSTIATLAGVVLLTVFGGWGMVQWLFEPSALVNSLPEASSAPNGVNPPPVVSTSLAQMKPAAATAQKTITAAKTDSIAIAAVQGLLRVGNPTDHPVRVAVLLKKPGTKNSTNQSQSGYESPAHWDFDPGEGSEKGLLLSLPNRQIKLKKGDILVAFAQDGSRRYWGPYVVGETSIPAWTPKVAEWRLTLQP